MVGRVWRIRGSGARAMADPPRRERHRRLERLDPRSLHGGRPGRVQQRHDPGDQPARYGLRSCPHRVPGCFRHGQRANHLRAGPLGNGIHPAASRRVCRSGAGRRRAGRLGGARLHPGRSLPGQPEGVGNPIRRPNSRRFANSRSKRSAPVTATSISMPRRWSISPSPPSSSNSARTSRILPCSPPPSARPSRRA